MAGRSGLLQAAARRPLAASLSLRRNEIPVASAMAGLNRRLVSSRRVGAELTCRYVRNTVSRGYRHAITHRLSAPEPDGGAHE